MEACERQMGSARVRLLNLCHSASWEGCGLLTPLTDELPLWARKDLVRAPTAEVTLGDLVRWGRWWNVWNYVGGLAYCGGDGVSHGRRGVASETDHVLWESCCTGLAKWPYFQTKIFKQTTLPVELDFRYRYLAVIWKITFKFANRFIYPISDLGQGKQQKRHEDRLWKLFYGVTGSWGVIFSVNTVDKLLKMYIFDILCVIIWFPYNFHRDITFAIFDSALLDG